MHIRFTSIQNGKLSPSILGDRVAAFGEATLGPLGLASLLETALGLVGPPVARAERLARWLPSLQSRDAFWSRSFQDDELGVARTLLGWRDELSLHGWLPEITTGRLSDLAAVDEAVRDGLPDRLRSIAEGLRERNGPTPVRTVELVEPEEELPLLWRRVLQQLRETGSTITQYVWPATPPSNRVQLLRAFGPREAAEEVGAWLAGQPDWRDTVLIAPNLVLDTALARHALPTTGARDDRPGADWQLLSLALHLGFGPPDPAQVQELLLLRPNPIPWPLRRRLLRALAESPGVHSTAWLGAVEDGLGELSDQEARWARRCLDVLFETDPGHDGSPDDELASASIELRLGLLSDWQRDELEAGTPYASTLAAGLEHARLLETVLTASRAPRWSRQHLGRWLAEVALCTRTESVYSAQAGLTCVAEPGAIIGPANRVVWWNFVRRASDRVRELPLTETENDALRSAGVPLPTGPELARRQAVQWRRPVSFGQELLLVSPEHAPDGQEQHPHPLWDEIRAGSFDASVSHTPTLGRSIRLEDRLLLPLPTAARNWSVDSSRIEPREAESASSLATMVGCQLAWFLRYVDRVRPGRISPLSTGNQLKGTLAHEVFAEALSEPAGDADTLAQRALACCRTLGRKIAAELFQPGMRLERDELEDVIERSARELQAQLVEAGRSPLHQEHEVLVQDAGPFGNLRGRIDLVVGPPSGVIDFKWAGSGSKYQREPLRNGTAHQLAVYAWLVQARDGHWPAVAFFLLYGQQLLTTSRDAFPGARVVPGPPPADTWSAFSAGAARAWSELTAGTLEAPGVDADGVAVDLRDLRDRVDGGQLVLAPPCRFCDYGPLCGRAFEEAAR